MSGGMPAAGPASPGTTGGSSAPEVEVVVLCCDRAFSGGDDPGGAPGRDGVSIRFSRLPCSGKVEVEHLMRLLESGADAVEVITCPVGKCQFLGGNERASRRVERARRLLDEAGVGAGRVGVSRAAGLDARGLRRLIRVRAEEARALGPNPIKEGWNR